MIRAELAVAAIALVSTGAVASAQPVEPAPQKRTFASVIGM